MANDFGASRMKQKRVSDLPAFLAHLGGVADTERRAEPGYRGDAILDPRGSRTTSLTQPPFEQFQRSKLPRISAQCAIGSVGIGLSSGSLGSCLLSPPANSKHARLLSPSTRPGRARMSHFACTASRKAVSPGATSSRISPTGDSMPLPPTCAATARRTVRRRSRRIGTNPSWTIRPRCSTRLACGGGGWSRMIGAR